MKQLAKAKKIFSEHEDMEIIPEMIAGINKIADVYTAHKKAVYTKKATNDFSNVDGMEFNEWAYDQLDDIKDVYQDLKAKLGQLQYEKNGFSVID